MWPTVIGAVALALGIPLWIFWRRSRDLAARLERFREEATQLREEHRQAVAQASAQQEALFNSMVEGVMLLDAAGRIRLVNHALENFFGIASDLRGKTILEAFQMHELQELAHRVLVDGQVRGYEIELPGLDYRSVQVNASVILDRDGRQQGRMLVFHDLTRLKQLENTRRDFVANVSHELRTPLSLIKGYCETLLDGAKDDPAVAPRFLQTIEKHADRLTFLIEDLLTISRLESGHVAMNFQNLELAPLVERTVAELMERTKGKNVVVRNEVPANLRVRADADRIQQVLYNLVDNAIKYGRNEVLVTVGAGNFDAGMVEVSVADNGPGIAPEHLDRIFERFYRIDRARSRDAGGTGLGLSIVKHIIQAHRGDVWATSELEKGSTFRFTLPLAD
jgi:two-component system phosphate regulon sensor histidine kinase PhoR